MHNTPSRRLFLAQTLGGVAALGLKVSAQEPAPASEHELAVISGKPRERGRQYGSLFKDKIRSFLEREIYSSFSGKPNTKEAMLRFAGACGKAITAYAAPLQEELEGIAEGSGLAFEEIVLITSHEELWHRGLVPAIDHCTVFGASAPDTTGDETFVCQTWDWMESVYGMSSILHWKRPEGPSVLAYSYPGLWTGAGMNTSGLALCWHTGSGDGKEPRVGIPAYVLIAQILYQETLKGALDEIRRATHSGWFVFLIGDGRGNFATVRGTPKNLEIIPDAKANGGRIRAEGDRKVDLPGLEAHCPRVKRSNTVDAMIFNCTKKELHVTRRAGGVTPWKKFTF
jgi:hypothetical protein